MPSVVPKWLIVLVLISALLSLYGLYDKASRMFGSSDKIYADVQIKTFTDAEVEKLNMGYNLSDTAQRGVLYITNQNSFAWHNVKITVNDGWTAAHDTLAPGEKLELARSRFLDSSGTVMPPTIRVQKTRIETSEGSATYS